MKDQKTYSGLLKTMNPFHSTFKGMEKVVDCTILTRIGTDLLA